MLDWFAEGFLKVFTAVPAWIFEEGTANFTMFRAMVGLAVVLFLIYVIGTRKRRR